MKRMKLEITNEDLAAMIKEGFDDVYLRFEQVDKRFEQMEERFVRMDERFDQMDQRFDRLEKRMDRTEMDTTIYRKHVALVDARLERIESTA